jgi:hypothetical protein
MKINKSESALLVVDLQARLLPAITEVASVLENALWLIGLQRMQRHGADVVSREMVAFEWLEEADTDIFRDILKHFIR